ncbi:MAG TPA: DUF2785 domain-containing protein [Actinomycetes bacterium]
MMEAVDRSFLRFLVESHALPQGEWVRELTPELLSWLGSTDAELRDEFAYPILTGWIERGQYGPDELRGIAGQMLGNLGKGLGESGTDSVFLRSFSALILMEVVARDNAEPFMDQQELRDLLGGALDYLRRERDLRGWVEGLGWAHAVAHTADLLMMLSRSRHLGAVELAGLLDGIADRLLTESDAVFLHQEDERLAYAVLNVLRRGLLDRAAVNRWLGRFVRPPGYDSWQPVFAEPGLTVARVNVTSFLRSLYFQLLLTKAAPDELERLLESVVEVLREMDIGFYELS